MKKFIFILFIINFSSLISYPQSGWVPLSSGVTTTLWSINFPLTENGSLGFAAGASGKILITTNSGSNWSLQPNPASSDLNCIFFIDLNTGWAAGGNGTILHTTNSGVNWLLQTSPTNELIYSIYFISQNTGWGAGSLGVIIYTTNGGANWTAQNSGTSEYLRSIYFTGLTHGISTGRNDKILITTNSGANWTDVNPGLTSTLYSVYFTSPLTGWAVGFGTLHTTNGGSNWALQQSQGILFSVYFASSSTGWSAGANGVINITTNSGVNWSSQQSGTANWLYSVCFTPPGTTGYICGDGGIILKTTDGGGLFTGINKISGVIPNKFSLSQNYPNPFNPTTKIKFSVPSVGNGRDHSLQLKIYDILGREVATLVNEQLKPGTYSVEWNAANFASGIYFYKLEAGSFTEIKKMVLLK